MSPCSMHSAAGPCMHGDHGWCTAGSAGRRPRVPPHTPCPTLTHNAPNARGACGSRTSPSVPSHMPHECKRAHPLVTMGPSAALRRARMAACTVRLQDDKAGSVPPPAKGARSRKKASATAVAASAAAAGERHAKQSDHASPTPTLCLLCVPAHWWCACRLPTCMHTRHTPGPMHCTAHVCEGANREGAMSHAAPTAH